MNAPTPKPNPAPVQTKQEKPPSVLLIGPSGTGKTFSISTLLEAGLEVFILVTEPNGLDTILDAVKEKKLDISKLHYKYVAPAAPGWKSLLTMAETINTRSYAEISDMKQGVDKGSTKQFIQVLKTLSDFVDDRTGESFGAVETWGPDRALVIDSLSGINIMAMDLTIGMKPAAHQGEWGVAMNLEEKLILQLTSSLNCFFVLIGHVDKEPNEVTGGTEVTVSALGRKLAPKIGRFFSEIALTRRDATGKFFWSTADSTAALKNRGLSFSKELKPSFQAVFDAHCKRVETAA